MKTIDLFAGAGGLSLGASRAGLELTAAVELDKFAMETHNRNFPNSVHLSLDVAKLTGDTLLTAAGLAQGELTGLIGGPPCQGFSSIGKRQVEDERNNLFGHFFRLVAETNPAFFLAENVPGLLDSQYDPIRKKAFKKVEGKYQLLSPIVVDASLYGAPTTRTRVFFFGYDPKRFSAEFSTESFAPGKDVEQIVVATALKGLPQIIKPDWQTEEQGWRSVGALDAGVFFDRVVNSIPTGIGNAQLLEKYAKGLVSGCLGTHHSDEVAARYKALQHGQRDEISRAVRLDPKGFCPTLRAGTAKDKGSFQAVRPIHYSKHRVITPREAARLQGFPDWFVFHHTKWHSFRQIGNSVSPIVAEDILSRIVMHLR